MVRDFRIWLNIFYTPKKPKSRRAAILKEIFYNLFSGVSQYGYNYCKLLVDIIERTDFIHFTPPVQRSVGKRASQLKFMKNATLNPDLWVEVKESQRTFLLPLTCSIYGNSASVTLHSLGPGVWQLPPPRVATGQESLAC